MFRWRLRRGSRKDGTAGDKKDVTDFFNVVVSNQGTYCFVELCIPTRQGRQGGSARTPGAGRLEDSDWSETKRRVVTGASDADFPDLTEKTTSPQPSRHAATGALTGGAQWQCPIPFLRSDRRWIGRSGGTREQRLCKRLRWRSPKVTPQGRPRCRWTAPSGLAPWIRGRSLPSPGTPRGGRPCATDGAAPAVWAERSWSR